jgi:very-short-patch-repair endonuclease
LRTEQTPWESKLWYHLRAGRFYGLKFKRQVQIGFYIYDFSCRDKQVIIEADGGQHSEKSISTYDQQKQSYAEKQSYKVLRFWNNEIDKNIQGVLTKIKEACGA